MSLDQPPTGPTKPMVNLQHEQRAKAVFASLNITKDWIQSNADGLDIGYDQVKNQIRQLDNATLLFCAEDETRNKEEKLLYLYAYNESMHRVDGEDFVELYREYTTGSQKPSVAQEIAEWWSDDIAKNFDKKSDDNNSDMVKWDQER